MVEAAPLTEAELELERRRARDRERSRRHRANKRHAHGAGHVAPDPVPAPGQADGARRSPLPVHRTRRMDDIGSTPEAYARVPPEVDAPEAPPPPPPSVDQEAGARKVAMIVAGMFTMATSDAAARYELGQRLAAAGVRAEEVPTWLAAASAHVHDCTYRAALRHGIGLTIPYEDEVTAIGAAGLSAAYLVAKATGRLERGRAELGRPVVDVDQRDRDPEAKPEPRPVRGPFRPIVMP
jgi:hypothetical protein